MRIHSLTIDNFRNIDHLEIRDLPERGVTIIHGDNEQGKSSILEALSLLLTVKHTSTKKEIKAVQPVGRDVPVGISARIHVGPYELTIAKRYVNSKSCELTVHQPRIENLSGGQAEQRFEDIVSQHLDRDLWDTLFMQQGDQLAAIDALGLTAVSTFLEDAHGGDGGVSEASALMAAVDNEYDTYFTKQGRYKKQITDLQKELALRERLFAEAADAEARLSRWVADHTRTERELRDCARALPKVEEELRKATLNREQAEKLQASLDRAALASSTLRLDCERAEQAATTRTALRDALATATRELTRLQGEHAVATTAATEEAKKVDEALTQRQAARLALRNAQGQLDAARSLERTVADRARKTELTELLAELDQLDARVAQATAALAAEPVTAAHVRAGEAAENEVRIARRIAESRASHLILNAAEPTTVTVDGAEISVDGPSEIPLKDGTTLVIGDVTGTYHTGERDNSPFEEVRRAEEELGEVLARYGVTDVDELRQRHREDEDAAHAAEQLREQRRNLLAGHHPADLRAELQALSSRLAQQEDDADAPETVDASTAAAAVVTAEAALKLAQEAEELADSRVAGLSERPCRDALTKLDILLEQASATRESVAGELTAAEEETTSEELTQAADAARTKVTEAEAAEAQARQLLDEAQIDAKRAAEEAAAAKLHSLTQRKHNAAVEKSRLEGSIELAAGTAERLADAEAQKANAQEALDREIHKAKVAQRLKETLQRYHNEARDAYERPFAEALAGYARAVFGPSVSFDFDNKLGVQRRIVGDQAIDIDSLSRGAKEQLALMTRFAIADMVSASEDGQPMPVIIDDALGSTDPERLDVMAQLFKKVGQRSQVIVLTCFRQRYDAIVPAADYSMSALKSTD
ncbi:AAA family ATPase [Corynebacterium uterequi]|uniref:AAA domain n=1 Tax=Corynebacterium uterequi TaxID=1072256 RepID=A0A0G3HDS0_9CORY|nr:AAA family ATPase [Corynebacterium uterequi]AKK10860.1 AAA domain [Corynebacterium uterequi]